MSIQDRLREEARQTKIANITHPISASALAPLMVAAAKHIDTIEIQLNHARRARDTAVDKLQRSKK
jgi:hypothetical protein